MNPYAVRPFRHTQVFRLIALAVLLLILSPRQAHATVWPACTASPTSSTIGLGSVNVPSTTPNGTPLGSPSTVNVLFDCTSLFNSYYDYGYTNATIQADIQYTTFDNTTTAPNGGIMFKTSVPGIDVELTATPTQASDGNNGPNSDPGWPIGTITPTRTRSCSGSGRNRQCTYTYTNTTLSATFTAQLVKVGAVTAGPINSITLLGFTNYTYGVSDSATDYATLSLGAVNVTTPACTVAVDPTVVTLPPVSATAFTGTNSTAGPTPFNVQLNCQSGSNLSITLATNNPQSGSTSVIAPSSGNGYAGNVGVQVLNGSSCTTPITFGTAISEGATPNGAMNLPFCARYYQTAPNVTAGTVSATATYTLTYQ